MHLLQTGRPIFQSGVYGFLGHWVMVWITLEWAKNITFSFSSATLASWQHLMDAPKYINRGYFVSNYYHLFALSFDTWETWNILWNMKNSLFQEFCFLFQEFCQIQFCHVQSLSPTNNTGHGWSQTPVGLKRYFKADENQYCKLAVFCKQQTCAYRRVRAFKVLRRLQTQLVRNLESSCHFKTFVHNLTKQSD